MGETYIFWGLVQSKGIVYPANLDHSIFYTEGVVQQEADGAVGTDLRFLHSDLEEPEDARIGEVLQTALLDDNQFVLVELEQDGWDDYRDSFEDQDDENGYISATFNQLVEEIDAGNLALSAGLKNASTVPTPDHDYTVSSYDWKEVSIVPVPASPGAWAWGCDEQCRTIFDLTMENKNVEIEGSGSQDGTGDGQEVQNPPAQPDTINMGDEQFKLVPKEEYEQNGCTCNTTEIEQELESVKEERNQLESLVGEFKQQRRDRLTSRIEQLNSDLPESQAWDEEEIEQMTENEDIQVLQAQADTMERLLPTTQETDVEQGEEDLSGSSESGSSTTEDEKERVDQAARELFGKSFNDVMDGLEGGDE